MRRQGWARGLRRGGGWERRRPPGAGLRWLCGRAWLGGALGDVRRAAERAARGSESTESSAVAFVRGRRRRAAALSAAAPSAACFCLLIFMQLLVCNSGACFTEQPCTGQDVDWSHKPASEATAAPSACACKCWGSWRSTLLVSCFASCCCAHSSAPSGAGAGPLQPALQDAALSEGVALHPRRVARVLDVLLRAAESAQRAHELMPAATCAQSLLKGCPLNSVASAHRRRLARLFRQRFRQRALGHVLGRGVSGRAGTLALLCRTMLRPKAAQQQQRGACV